MHTSTDAIRQERSDAAQERADRVVARAWELFVTDGKRREYSTTGALREAFEFAEAFENAASTFRREAKR
jgi:hypothetical protein